MKRVRNGFIAFTVLLLSFALMLPTTLVAAEAPAYQDGEYLGSAGGNGGTIKVAVVIKEGEIQAIKILEQNETPGLGDEAITEVAAAILTEQTVEVDSVAGATVSSKALKKAVASALAKAAGTAQVGQVAQDTYEADVLVIGAGGAGLSAAVKAAENGAEVLVLEKMPVVGGNTIRATGGMNAAGTRFQQEKGIEDSPDIHFEDTMKGGHYKNIPELVRVLVDNAAAAVDWLVNLGADLSDVGRLGGASNPRAHRPTGGAAVGATVVNTLHGKAEELGVQILTNTRATELLTDAEGNIVGAKALRDGSEIICKASAVVVATGGFGANQEFIASVNPSLKGFGTTNHRGATGDGLKMVGAVGAKLVDLDKIQTHPTVVPEKGIMITEAVRGNGAILVNRNGERFVNELDTRDVVSEAILSQPGKTAFLIFDDGVRASLSAIEKYARLGLLTEGTLSEVAGTVGIDADNLAGTVAAYNEAVANGEDVGFGRTAALRQLNEGQYYAVEVAPAVHHTMGGVAINEQAQVLSEDGAPIAGLYAAGEVTGGIHGANRLGGNAVADIMVFGQIAGENAAKYAAAK